MLLALDMGNTNITIGVYEKDSLRFESRLATDCAKMEDQYAVEIMDILRLYGIEPREIEGAIISSVVPPLDRAIAGAVEKITGVAPMMVGPGTKTGIDIRIDNPAQLGADLLVGAVAAVARYGAPCIIWDLGTATTVSVVNDKGWFLGGAIMPGIGVSFNHLTQKTALLPSIRMEAPRHVIGPNSCLLYTSVVSQMWAISLQRGAGMMKCGAASTGTGLPGRRGGQPMRLTGIWIGL